MSIESPADFEGMSRVGHAVAAALKAMSEYVRPGVSTAEVDGVGAQVLRQHGARSAPQMFYGFPGVNLISVNDEVVHGVPGDRMLLPGDLVTLDVTAELDGYVADAARTIPLPPYSEITAELCRCARAAFEKATAVARAGRPIHCIGKAVEQEVRESGFAVVRELGGHGVGRHIHETPFISNVFKPTDTQPLTDGLVLTIEPIIAERSGRIFEDDDGWTIRTVDGGLSAHYENTVVIRTGVPILLTAA
ncbi:MAG: type I methionyl aminopeptidase [Candidatus Poribacteria bacterium]|nr:type I methionyl aminopeptidase [Candidatus Poribacteria bacterium]MDE0505681.1 type I methionyl aminopeptidase [Candidatus Poribacteria bacterium]